MRNFNKAKRIVVKIGTSTLSKNGGVNTAYVGRMAGQIKAVLDSGKSVVIVSSGSIGMGAGQLGLFGKVKEVQMRQACAAIGQPLLMHEYHKAFSRHGIIVGQVLLTAEVLDHRKTYLNLRNSIEKLLELGVVPIINENDCVATDEIGTAFGDNDTLSALVASKIDADLLIMLSDIDALYDKDPKKHADAKPIHTVYEITKEIEENAGEKGSSHAVGGMKTKLEAARIASSTGCRIVLVDGKARNIISRVLSGAEVGTVFMPKRKLSSRCRWILNSQPAGTIVVDQGALEAITNHKSLLPSGIVSVKENFEANCVVMINDAAKAVTSFSSVELKELAGKHSTEIREILGPGHRDVIAVPEDIVFLDF